MITPRTSHISDASSAAKKPIIIQIFNAFNTNDLSIQPKDNDEASVQVIFTGHYDPNDLETPPYKIYWPKEA